MRSHVSTALFLSISVASICGAILTNESASKSDGHADIVQQATPTTPSERINSNNLTISTDSAKLDANSTFYYEADTFLLNGKTHAKAEAAKASKPTTLDEGKQKAMPAAAGHQAVSGRNGRMLDLDELVGDLDTARANKERRAQITNRQSRNLNGAAHLDISGGKRLHIQGFIPIVGIKDDQGDDEAGNGKGPGRDELVEQLHSSASALRTQQPRLKMLPSNQQLGSLMESGLDLPYGQSSLGHASFNVQRYLNTDNQLPADAGYSQYMTQTSAPPQVKYTAGIVETLKKPIQKLTNTFGGSNNDQQQQKLAQQQLQLQQQQQQQQNCLCVPFYMCKNGYISESGLGRSQIQQMIQQQQTSGLVQQPRQAPLTDQTRPGSSESVPVGASFANSFVPVDERSFESELVTAPTTTTSTRSSSPSSMMVMGSQEDPKQDVSNAADVQAGQPASSEKQSNQPNHSVDAAEGQSQAANMSSLPSELPPLEEMTTLNQSSDYSQDILGRMLGLKANSRISMLGSSSSSQSSAANQQQQSNAGVCGLLRTCCNIPISLFPTQQQQQHHHQQQQQQQQQQSLQQTSQQQVALQRYQQPYASASHQMVTRAQSLAPSYAEPTSIGSLQPASLYHRTSSGDQHIPQQRPMASAPMMGMPSNSVQQYARAPLTKQPLQSFQAPFVASPPAPLSINQQLVRQSFSPNQQGHYQPGGGAQTAVQLGSRKLLEGRCGLRQSAGINGRVQNLAGSENSADFGEYPAQAAILKRLNGSESLFVCSGTLISQSWVATAAHCIRKHLGQGQLRVRLGEWDVHRDDEFYPYVEKDVRDLVIHPDFVPGNLINDIALVRLDSAVDPTLPHVNPACLPAADESFARQRCWVAGWGKDAFGQQGAFQSVLQEVELPVLGHAECESALRQTRLGPHYRLHPGFTCAGGESGKDACEGDGGSGLYCSQEGVIKVAGLVSWGISCGQRNVPGVFVSMTHYRPWIENIISIDDDIYSSYNALPANTLISERSAANNSTSQTEVQQGDMNKSTNPTTSEPATASAGQ